MAKRLEDSDLGIASIVVMEEDPQVISYIAGLVSKAITQYIPKNKPVLLVTAESKGSYFVPWVWSAMEHDIGPDRLLNRIITLRKGGPKKYMNRPVIVCDRQVIPSVEYYSITSNEPQIITISPKDGEHLTQAISIGAEPVYIDDFLGQAEQ